ncbi:lysozyme [Nitrosospira sp. Nsp11]|uniref:glycoside hydrolase family protein n=1 Tax=Nitrosospira sp. Nsp11 TaxID=1855338 RepID=UPI0009158DA2|nr:glycoside hydrolase family protein [Nitrosospira sp. Nsp11]SHM10955.1 lysozyme [Nitrosospira sp. Nsp11]
MKPSVNQVRSAVAVMMVSASLYVGIAQHEGYVEVAAPPVAGDVPTNGFGSTAGVRLGDKTTPVRAMIRLLNEIEDVYAAGVRKCVTVPLYQHEFDAYVSLAYNVGVGAVCRKADKRTVDDQGKPKQPEPDRLIDVLNKADYDEACRRIKSFNRFQGKVMRGLTIRREAEYKQCLGLA